MATELEIPAASGSCSPDGTRRIVYKVVLTGGECVIVVWCYRGVVILYGVK